MTTVREAMTPKPAFCKADATLQEVAQKMIAEDTGFIPILDNGRVCGAITDRDIVVRAIAKGLNPTQAIARDFCTRDLELVSPDMSIDEAIQHMEARQIRRLLVCDRDKVVGVVSLGDLAECSPREAEDVLVEVSKSTKTLSHQRQA